MEKGRLRKRWLDGNSTKIVLICGGKGTRLMPYTKDTAKSLIAINGKPIIRHIVDFWSNYSEDLIFILNKNCHQIMEYIMREPMSAQFIIEDNEPKGIASALKTAQGVINGNFAVVLGDCLFKGAAAIPDEMEQGFGIWKTNDEGEIRNSYSVEIEDCVVRKVVEKPDIVTNDICGTGFYFFNKTVFDYIDRTKPSKRSNRVELTDVIQTMIDDGRKITPVVFNGAYININYCRDVKKAEEIFK